MPIKKHGDAAEAWALNRAKDPALTGEVDGTRCFLTIARYVVEVQNTTATGPVN